GGSAAAVAGGLLPIATGGDGGGSIRIPAGFCGLVGMKGTAGRIPRGPRTEIAPMTVVVGCLARSVRDVARWFDVCSGYDSRDPHCVPRGGGWERDLGTRDLGGLRAVTAPDLGSAVVRPEVEEVVREAGEALARDTGLRLVDVPVRLPGLGFEWAMTNLAQLRRALGDRWPGCKDDMTLEMAFGMQLADDTFDLSIAAACERQRTEANERMAEVFDQVDVIICATNPDVAFPAEVTLNTRVGDRQVGPENNGALTIPANIVGNPAISVPAGTVDGLPVGMQIIGRHHEDALLLGLALSSSASARGRWWPRAHRCEPRGGRRRARMSWTLLVVAGQLDVAWASVLPSTEGLTRPAPTAAFVLLLSASMYGLARATETIPIGTGYAVWVGIGALGTAVVGILRGDPASPTRPLCLGLIVAGVVG